MDSILARLRILTGAPGTGKTAILNALGGRFAGEPAREILAEQRASGGEGTPDQNPSRFVELLLERSIAKHRDATRTGDAVLFDRGVPDCVAYAEILGVDPGPSIQAAKVHRYHPVVLVARPWGEIYSTDDERKMTFEATFEFQRLIERAYEVAGYTLVEIPRGPIEARSTFVREAGHG